MKNFLPLILGMTAVTYLPRLLPLLIMKERPLHPALRRFLLYIPYTALSTMIMSGVMHSTKDMRLATLAGIAVAGICSWLKGGLVISVLLSITIAMILSL